VNRKTYAEAGVSLTAAEAVVERLRNAVESTGAQGFGAFAGLYPLDDERLLAASTDGVGTKLILLREAGRLRDGGRDLAAHCINDVLTTGAKPLFLLDYVAANAIDLDEIAELVEGAADVCREARCALLGGETAEHPGLLEPDEYDLAGSTTGIITKSRLRSMPRTMSAAITGPVFCCCATQDCCDSPNDSSWSSRRPSRPGNSR